VKALRLPALALAAGLAAGCGSGDETDYYALIPVTGKVTLEGEPLAGAKVIFTPQGNVPDTPASDVTGKSGTYNVMYRGRAGVAKGKYSVLVSKTLGEAAEEVSADSPEGFSEERALAAMRKAAEQTAAFVKRGGKKTRPIVATETFDREVDGSAVVFDFDLKKP